MLSSENGVRYMGMHDFCPLNYGNLASITTTDRPWARAHRQPVTRAGSHGDAGHHKAHRTPHRVVSQPLLEVAESSDAAVALQVKELAAEVMDHLRSSLDSHLLTQAFAEARARSSALKALRRKEAAVKVPLWKHLWVWA